MRRKLTLVVTCTDGKTIAADPSLRVRSLRSRDPESRRREWGRRVQSATRGTTVPLRSLYKGQLWQASLRLEKALAASYDVQTLVASAGLGLREVDQKAPAYAATFSTGHADTVATDRSDAENWWESLSTLPGSVDLGQLPGPRVLIVASDAYARAMEGDLISLGRHRHGQVLLFGGSREVDGITRIPANRRLRTELGCSTATVNVHSAMRWIEQSGRDILGRQQLAAWRAWATADREDDMPRRARISDDDVLAFVREVRAEDPNISCTAAHRRLRISGLACEQARFKALFTGRGN